MVWRQLVSNTEKNKNFPMQSEFQVDKNGNMKAKNIKPLENNIYGLGWEKMY